MNVNLRMLGREIIVVDAEYVYKAENAANFAVLNPGFKNQRCEDVAYAFTLNAYNDRFLVSANDFKPVSGLNGYDGSAVDSSQLVEFLTEALGVQKLGLALQNRLRNIATFFEKKATPAAEYKEPWFAYLYEQGVEAMNAMNVNGGTNA